MVELKHGALHLKQATAQIHARLPRKPQRMLVAKGLLNASFWCLFAVVQVAALVWSTFWFENQREWIRITLCCTALGLLFDMYQSNRYLYQIRFVFVASLLIASLAELVALLHSRTWASTAWMQSSIVVVDIVAIFALTRPVDRSRSRGGEDRERSLSITCSIVVPSLAVALCCGTERGRAILGFFDSQVSVEEVIPIDLGPTSLSDSYQTSAVLRNRTSRRVTFDRALVSCGCVNVHGLPVSFGPFEEKELKISVSVGETTQPPDFVYSVTLVSGEADHRPVTFPVLGRLDVNP